jgi:hypothetical protein
MSRSIIELALKVLKRGTSLTYQDELTEREQAIKGLEDMLKREWVGLTDEELKPLCDENPIMFGAYTVDFIQAIEAKLKEKNHG